MNSKCDETWTCDCGHKARFVAGEYVFDMVLKQFFCESCGKAFVIRNGKFLREGSLEDRF